MKIETMDQFKRVLSGFDWYYAYSDDHRVWKKWADEEDRLRQFYRLLPLDLKEEAKSFWDSRCPKTEGFFPKCLE